MKLLLDENLSRRLVPLLQDHFPGTSQVALLGLERAVDSSVWEYAKTKGFAIVTKDDDFLGLLSVHGYPPKVVYLSMGNCSNETIAEVLKQSRDRIASFLADDDVGMIEVY